MRCYNHHEKHGVAMCKSCGRCICHECIHESGEGITCNRETCITALSEKNEFHRKHAAHLKNLKRLSFLGSLFSAGMGILFVYFSTRGYGLVYDFIFLLGIGFIVYGIVALFANMIIFFIKEKT